MGEKTVLVTGATGTVSTALLGALKGKPNLRLRALVRDPAGAKAQALQKDGVEVVAGDLEAPDLLTSAGSVASDGMLYMNMGQGRVGMIDGRDVGVFGAKIIEQTDRHAGKTYTPTGPEVTTMAESAETLSSLLGKRINYVALPPEAAQQAMLGFGLSRWFVGNVVDYGRVYSEGWGDFTTSDFKDITGQEARSFKQFATDFAPAFGGSPVAAHA